MDKSINFSDLEMILRKAIKLSDYSIKELADVAGMSKSGLYCFVSGQNHISAEKGDLIINYLKENNPQTLRVAADLYFK